MSRLNDTSDKLLNRPKASNSSSNKSKIVNSKDDNTITQQDQGSKNKSARRNCSKSFEEYSDSSPNLDDCITSDGDSEMPFVLYQVANHEGEGKKMKLNKDSFGDSNNLEDGLTEDRDASSTDSSTCAKSLNGTLDTTNTKGSDTKSEPKGGNMTAKIDVCDNRRYQKYDDHEIGKHVCDSAKSRVSEAESKSTRGSEAETRKRCGPIEHNPADQHDSYIKTANAIGSKMKASDQTRSRDCGKIDVKFTKDIKEHRESNDELSVPRNSSPKYNKGGARSKKESCMSSFSNRSGVSVPKERASADDETRRHYDEETSEVRKTVDSSNSKFPVCDSDSDRSRSSSSSRSSRSGEHSGSGSQRSRTSNFKSSSSGSDHSNSRSNRTSCRSNSSNGMKSQNGSQSSREGSANRLNWLAASGAIPSKRDGMTEVHIGSGKNERSAADNATSVSRINSESNTSSRLISEDIYRNRRGQTNNRVQEDKRECSRRSETRKKRSSKTGTDSTNLGNDGYGTRKNERNLVLSSEKADQDFGPSYHLNHSKPIGPTVHLEYEWQYRDDQGGWVTYGQSGGIAPGSKMVTSKAIEQYYTEDPDRTPLMIEFNNNKYILDLQTMRQTSQRTAHQRDIRRILKLPENKNSPQNTGGNSGSRAASGRNNTSGGRYGVDFPSNTGDGRADQVVRYDSNMAAETNAGRGYAGNYAHGRDSLSVLYEWQFKDEHGKWIAYGKANSFFDKSNATTGRSEDIEKAYSNKHNMPYFVIESSQHSYMLDFENMIQINNQTKVVRPIRREVKEFSKKDRVVKSVEKFFENLTGLKHYKEHKKEFTTLHEWQFLDEHGVWIAYGKANFAGNVVCTTDTTSDDIEKYVSSGAPKQRMTINSTHNTYNLDFHNMTQTNTRTSIQRPIRRVLKHNRDDSDRNYNPNTAEETMNANHGYNSTYVAPGRPTNKPAVTHFWQFEDERGQWITYGESCSTVTSPFTTREGSDDIEEYYLKNNGEVPMFVRNTYNDYILDFQTMLQTNQSTSVQRRIRRVIKPNVHHR